MEITIYGSPMSPFVVKVLRACALKGLEPRVVEPRGPTDMRKWNPQTGKMPAADLDGERLYDSTFILRRLDERVPEPPLVADDPTRAAAQRQLEDWADESLYWYAMAFRFTEKNAPGTVARIASGVPALLRPVVAPLIKRQIRGMTRAQGMGRLPQDVLEREFAGRLDDLLRMLGERPFFYADRPSVADLAVHAQLAMALEPVAPETRRAIQERPALLDYLKRVEQATGG